MRISSLPPATYVKSSIALPKDPTSPQNIAKTESVELSQEGLELYRKQVEKKDSAEPMSELEIWEKYQRIYGENTFRHEVSAKLDKDGDKADFTDGNPERFSDEQLARIQKSTKYMNERFNAIDVLAYKYKTSNPFYGVPRAELAAIVEDESGCYTDIERTAALYAMSDIDFRNVGATRETENDIRPLLKYYGAFLEELSPVERLRFPKGEEERVARELMVAEAEFGKLPEGFSIWDWLLEHQSDVEGSIDTPAAELLPTETTPLGHAETAHSKPPIEPLTICDWIRKFEARPDPDLQPTELSPPET